MEVPALRIPKEINVHKQLRGGKVTYVEKAIVPQMLSVVQKYCGTKEFTSSQLKEWCDEEGITTGINRGFEPITIDAVRSRISALCHWSWLNFRKVKINTYFRCYYRLSKQSKDYLKRCYSFIDESGWLMKR